MPSLRATTSGTTTDSGSLFNVVGVPAMRVGRAAGVGAGGKTKQSTRRPYGYLAPFAPDPTWCRAHVSVFALKRRRATRRSEMHDSAAHKVRRHYYGQSCRMEIVCLAVSRSLHLLSSGQSMCRASSSSRSAFTRTSRTPSRWR